MVYFTCRRFKSDKRLLVSYIRTVQVVHRSTPGPTNVYHSPGRLLMPTLRPQQDLLSYSSANLSATGVHGNTPVIPPRSPRLRPTAGKLIRTKSGTHSSIDASSSSPHIPFSPIFVDIGTEWLGIPLKFEVVEDQIEVEGFQMYAVEKWCVLLPPSIGIVLMCYNRIVERTRPVTTLTVFTGDPSHKARVVSSWARDANLTPCCAADNCNGS
jgi:hypothetical protein